ncbi:YkoF family thiamine/hydroxymethylpyrimidine-binding protein [Cellulomonas telluris]|uniref:YkoF family thiamine/hydroxymethylpyrimidine-binding protein n=1 Tax=Cellulomonas telluris TaxID=2306636 RepID=UPI0010A7BFC1|nr:YkoF family thiamine/hydroxymethylpyrimidine-binding protein [Cellulomonas telluris]
MTRTTTRDTDADAAPGAASTAPALHDDRRARACALGVGARVSVHPHRDDFAPVLLAALDALDRTGVDVVTDDVSTLVRGPEPDVLRAVVALVAAVARGGGHVVAHVHLSRGCPGEVACDLGDDVALAPVDLPLPAPVGLPASAHWALYPLGVHGHLDAVLAAVEEAGTRVRVTPEHYVTRLDGDLADVLGAVALAWARTGEHVRHVVTHVTVSVGSPSAAPAHVAVTR